MAISSWLASTMVLLGFHHFILSFKYFIHAKVNDNLNVIMIGFTSLIFAYFTLINDSYGLRIITFSSMMVILSLQACVLFYEHIVNHKQKYYYFPLISFVIYFFAYSFRIIQVIGGRHGVSFMDNSSQDNIFMLASMLASILMMTGLIYVINGRLIEELKIQAITRENLLNETKSLAEIDSLTGLYNRMKSEEILYDLQSSIKTSDQSFGFMLIDIDHFKSINDSFGHPEGDKILKCLASVLNRTVRKTDFVGRWGGDEFIVILPEVSPLVARRIAEKIKAEVAEIICHNRIITLSIGIGIYGHQDNLHDFISDVDTALYEAKHSGRNAFVFHKKEARLL